MSDQNIVQLGFNVDELKSEQKQVLDIFTELFGKLQGYDGTKIDPFTAGLTEMKKSLQSGSTAMTDYVQSVNKLNSAFADQAQKQQQSKKTSDDVTAAIGQYEKIVNQASQTQAKLNASTSTAAENNAIDSQQLKSRNAELQNSAKYLTAESNSVAEARAQNALLTVERDNQNTATEEGRAKIISLNATIDANNKFIQENSDKLARQKINIGNYTGAVEILKESLASISQQLQTYATSGDTTSEAYQRLILEQSILNQLMQKQTLGFNTAQRELGAYKSALDAIAIAGLKDTPIFEALNNVITKETQAINKVTEGNKILTSTTPGLTALTTVARGLGGAYAVGAGASALFADGNEKVQKSLNQLIGIMTLLQGLEEAIRVIRERGALATELERISTIAVAGATAIKNKLFSESVAITTENTVATEANTAATEENAGAQVASSETIKDVGIASKEAEVATVSFGAALTTLGIGALIITVIAVGKSFLDVGASEKEAAERAIELDKAIELLNKTLQDEADLANIGPDKLKKNFETQLDYAEKIGSNYYQQLAIKKQIAEQDLKIAEKNVTKEGGSDDLGESLRTLNSQMEKAKKNMDGIADEKLGLDNKAIEARAFADALKKAGGYAYIAADQYASNAEAAAKSVDDQFQGFKKFYDERDKIVDGYNKGIKGKEDLSIEESKKTADELIEITRFEALARAKAITDSNNIILNDERSTEARRIAALQSNLQQEINIIEAERKAKLADKTLTPTQKQEVNETANDDETAAVKKSKEDQRKLKFDYYQRDLEAETTISKNQLQAQSDIQQAITKDLQQELETRLGALKSDIADRTDIIETDYNKQIELAKKTGKTQTEIDAIESNRQKELVALTADTQKQIYDIVTSYGDKRLKDVEELNKTGNQGNEVSDNYNKETAALNQSLFDQNISYEHFLEKKSQLDKQYAIDKAAADVRDDEAALQRAKDLAQKEIGIQLALAEVQLENAKAGGNDDEIKNAQAKVDALKGIYTKANADEVAADKKLNDDEAKLNDAKLLAIKAAEEKVQSNVKEIKVQAYNLAVDLINAEYENKIKKIQDETAIADAATAREIENVNASSLTNREKQEEDIILQAQIKARDTQAKLEEQQEKVKEAKFDQKLALAQIAWSTAKAVMKDTADVPFPLSLEVAASDIALGAIQGALVLAKGIPSYGEGVEDHPGGLALVGELYKPEKIKIPGKQPFIVDAPQYLDLPKNTSVTPMEPDIMGMAMQGFHRGMEIVHSVKDNSSENPAWAVARWQVSQTKKIFRASKQTIVNKIIVPTEYGLSQEYVNSKILGKR